MKDFSLLKTQTPNSDADFSETITKGFEFVPHGKIATKFTICAKTNLKLIVKNECDTMVLYLEQGSGWGIDSADGCDFTSIMCDSESAKVTYMLGYRNR